MLKTLINSKNSVSEYWNELRTYLLDRILGGFLLLAAVGMPISLSRVFTFGWQPVYVVQLLIAICVILLHLFRYRLSFSFKLTFLVVSLFLLSFMGLKTFGLASGGVPFLILLQFLAASFYRPHVGLIYFILTSILFIGVGISFITGNLEIQVNFNAYMTNISAWMSVWIVFTVISIVAFHAMGMMQHTLLVLLREVEHQRDEIHHLANHDHLTGLPTMRLAQDRLKMAIHHADRNNEKVAILFIDLDGFKQINDRLGHECGDYTLKEIARCMSQIVRTDDTVARRGGDEFLVILGGITDLSYVSIIAQRIIDGISRPILYNHVSFALSASIGISIFPDNSRSIEKLQHLADEAMYSVKNAQKNNFMFSRSSKEEIMRDGFF